uniref:hypothetical protein n=1 Tax=Paramuribaculum intestinale TaxID=2094151 RepID=UPI0025B66116
FSIILPYLIVDLKLCNRTTEQIFSREAKKEELRQVKVLKEQEKKQNANRNKWIGEWIKQNYGCESSKLTIEQKKEVVN